MKKLTLPQKIILRDTTVREGFQREERLIPTSAKLWVVEQLVQAGFKRLEVTNFANPKRLPQFADAEELLRLIRTHRSIAHLIASVELTAITINQRAVNRALAAKQKEHGPDRILMVVSVSEAYQQANSGMSIDEYWKMAAACVQLARDNDIKVCGAINSIWGCPKAGPMDMKKAVAFAERWLQIGAHDIEHADHDGSAIPDKVYDYFSRVLDAGISGLVSTEDLVVMLDEMGMKTGLDVDAVLKIGAMVERIVGRRLRSECVHTGRIPKALKMPA